MIEILMVALVTRLNQENSPVMPQPNVWDIVRLAILLMVMVLALALAVIH